jgi:hypothetical protein
VNTVYADVFAKDDPSYSKFLAVKKKYPIENRTSFYNDFINAAAHSPVT